VQPFCRPTWRRQAHNLPWPTRGRQNRQDNWLADDSQASGRVWLQREISGSLLDMTQFSSAKSLIVVQSERPSDSTYFDLRTKNRKILAIPCRKSMRKASGDNGLSLSIGGSVRPPGEERPRDWRVTLEPANVAIRFARS
jgi:hypothetical protein